VTVGVKSQKVVHTGTYGKLKLHKQKQPEVTRNEQP